MVISEHFSCLFKNVCHFLCLFFIYLSLSSYLQGLCGLLKSHQIKPHIRILLLNIWTSLKLSSPKYIRNADYPYVLVVFRVKGYPQCPAGHTSPPMLYSKSLTFNERFSSAVKGESTCALGQHSCSSLINMPKVPTRLT